MEKKPRFISHVGIQMDRPQGGKSRCTLKLQDFHVNGTGVTHGGVLFTMADTGMGAALFSLLEKDEICATIETKITYFKPVFEGEVVCTAEVVNKGKSVASMEASMHVGEQLVARASGSFAVFKRKTDAGLAG